MLIDRGFGERNRRVKSLDVESYQDFVLGFRDFTYGSLDKAARESADAIFADKRVNDPETLELATIREALDNEPMIQTRVRCWLSSQQLMWQNVLDHYEQNRDHYLDEMEAADGDGPGSLELNTGMAIPDYAKHEIHIQPGGYTGNDFAGPLYHYGTNTFYKGQNNEDQFQLGIADNVGLPADGKVSKVVDFGCGIGRLSVALAQKFPQAEVWGIDVGGPLVRYAHKRARELGVPVHFAQRLAEDSKFESGSVDLVTAYILFHEVSPEAAVDICKEAFRILRPGGVFDVTDFHTGAARGRDPYRRYMGWIDHVYNAERWSHDFVYSDFLETLRSVGFEAEKGANRFWGIGAYIARKPG
ncbi:MAG TPA: methyltransferase domain-containing protein [Novosphingobium sp.]|nr:methyltransferase domain-containing protein [Novosphingobium sp.]